MFTTTADLDGLARHVLFGTDAMVVVVDSGSRLLAVNPAVESATGVPADELVGEDAVTLVVPRDVPDFQRALRVAIRTGAPSASEHELAIKADGERRSIAWSITPVAHDPVVLACIGVDVSATRNEFEVLRSRAVSDELTGLPNRAGLLEQLCTMAGSGASVVFCDLNGFKAVNDTFGHAAGDAVLVQVARRLKRTVRGEDFVARLGGDEFVIVVPPDPNSDFEALSRRLMRAMSQPMVLAGGIVATVGMSIGVSVLVPGEDPANVLTIADADMYRMKSRNTTQMMGMPSPEPTAVAAGE